MEFLNSALDYVQQATGLSQEVIVKIIKSLLVILIAPIFQWLVMSVVRRRAKEPTMVYRAFVAVRYVVTIGALVFLAGIWIRGVGQLATYLSIVSAGLVIALQDSVSNMAGFLFIVWRKPFKLGDRIEITGIQGDVIDIRIFQFTVVEVGNWVDADQSTGRIVHIPNSKVMVEATANYTTGFEYIWNEVPVLVTFESNWREAKAILQRIAAEHCEQFTPEAERQIRKAAQRYMIIAGKLTPIVYTSVKDSGVLVTLRYLTLARTRRGTEPVSYTHLTLPTNREV